MIKRLNIKELEIKFILPEIDYGVFFAGGDVISISYNHYFLNFSIPYFTVSRYGFAFQAESVLSVFKGAFCGHIECALLGFGFSFQKSEV